VRELSVSKSEFKSSYWLLRVMAVVAQPELSRACAARSPIRTLRHRRGGRLQRSAAGQGHRGEACGLQIATMSTSSSASRASTEVLCRDPSPARAATPELIFYATLR
jgi:hypothetical protein